MSGCEKRQTRIEKWILAGASLASVNHGLANDKAAFGVSDEQ
jgi:hypothetical protein